MHHVLNMHYDSYDNQYFQEDDDEDEDKNENNKDNYNPFKIHSGQVTTITIHSKALILIMERTQMPPRPLSWTNGNLVFEY